MSIPLCTVYSQEYWNNVFSPFVDAAAAGATPNPDLDCNKFIKFGAFLRWAEAHGADAIATGHYSRIAPAGDGRCACLRCPCLLHAYLSLYACLLSQRGRFSAFVRVGCPFVFVRQAAAPRLSLISLSCSLA